ncbi:GGDEF domain-containing protein, partial [Pseudomonas viridiflava]|uniref:GGDEF domain-containing protein n=1 Tax=Pseudomonas viridiflava TaxID=33069 RepID=UPI00177F1C3D
ACKVAEAILRKLQEQRIEHPQSPFEIVTVSLGVATFVGTDRHMDQRGLIQLSDRALYAAKSQVFFQVSVASEIVTHTLPAWTQGPPPTKNGA